MISEKRALAIFQSKGGESDSVRVINTLTDAQRVFLRQVSGQIDNPLIAGVLSDKSWFILTSSKIIAATQGSMRAASLSDIVGLLYPNDAGQLADAKVLGGRIQLALRDGSVFEIESDPGKPLIGLVNVFIYIAKKNHAHKRS